MSIRARFDERFRHSNLFLKQYKYACRRRIIAYTWTELDEWRPEECASHAEFDGDRCDDGGPPICLSRVSSSDPSAYSCSYIVSL